ncbi:P-loop containing nucleoside triphosphate hydrolase protein [Mycena olivaceomarginata]|nr:P-loop containing nucleoside triphosphate hydrolase protein [Mycena olivaceomarginata]
MSTSFTADEFVNIWVDAGDTNDDNEFYRKWSDHASAKHAAPPLQIANALKKAYPDHSPHAPLVSKAMFIPGARKNGEATGWVLDQIDFAAFVGAWDNYDFLVYLVTGYPTGYGTTTLFAILHQGRRPELIMKHGLWSSSLHNEIWVYNQGYWQKDYALWQSIQTADWKDVILDDGFKKDLQKDIYGFFKSEPIYRDLAIPWKRGIIMHGPPGNGKTISIKVIMKTCDALGFAPLYVKSFQNYFGEEVAMQQVFDMARQLSPCVIVLEDLDALINDRNRSFFLNQLDGLQGNDGLLVIGTTNHFDRLDPGLSTRPSRFDRKYKFDDPTREERVLYVKYWQDKLESNKEIEFPDALVDEVADLTDKFSFAYLKEAFVSSLVTLAGYEGDDKPSFPSALKAQIKTLRKQLDKSTTEAEAKRDFRPLFDTLSDAAPVFSVFPPAGPQQPSPTPGEPNFRAHLDQARRAMMALSTPSAWDSAHTQIAGLAYYNAPTLN